ncbi:MAG: glutathione S-transferase [Rhodobiaceae bacterium]|nr:glutathione S-transferase [Rhodobiaceae bacterium]MCC0056339.1 glutathione S-transferase [Rhodobiaceae bacterium]
MMILRSSPASPFGRKVKIAMHHLGLADQITVEKSDTTDPADSIRSQNPLGKIPALILTDGTVIYDSPVILEFLDALAGGGGILPRDGADRWRVLTLHALGDGIMDAALLQVYEKRFRDEATHNERWLDLQAGKITRGLTVLNAGPPEVAVNMGTIAIACALGYLDLRFEGAWRKQYPALEAWLTGFAAAVPSFEKTAPPQS